MYLLLNTFERSMVIRFHKTNSLQSQDRLAALLEKHKSNALKTLILQILWRAICSSRKTKQNPYVFLWAVLLFLGKHKYVSYLSSVISVIVQMKVVLLLVTDVSTTWVVKSSSESSEELSSDDYIYASGCGLDWSALCRCDWSVVLLLFFGSFFVE